MTKAERDGEKAEKRYKAFYEKEIRPALKQWHRERIKILRKMIDAAKLNNWPKREIKRLERELGRALLGEY